MINLDQLKQEVSDITHEFDRKVAMQVIDYLSEKGYLKDEWQPMDAEFQADREVERLVAEFGGLEQWEEVSLQLLEYGRRNLPPSVLEGMACSFEGVMALYHLMKGEASSLKGGTSSATNETDLWIPMPQPPVEGMKEG